MQAVLDGIGLTLEVIGMVLKWMFLTPPQSYLFWLLVGPSVVFGIIKGIISFKNR